MDFIIVSLVIRYFNYKWKIPDQRNPKQNNKTHSQTINKKTFIKMQSKLYIDMTLIKILLECTVKENKGNKWAIKNWNGEKKDPILSFPVTAKALAICTMLGRCPHLSENLNGGPGPGGICFSCSVSWWCLFWSVSLHSVSAPAAASSQTDRGYPALFGYNREGVWRGFLHHLLYVHVEKCSQKGSCSRQVEKGLCRPEEFFNGRSCVFFHGLGIFKNMRDNFF